jgi:hypothetical protein
MIKLRYAIIAQEDRNMGMADPNKKAPANRGLSIFRS